MVALAASSTEQPVQQREENVRICGKRELNVPEVPWAKRRSVHHIALERGGDPDGGEAPDLLFSVKREGDRLRLEEQRRDARERGPRGLALHHRDRVGRSPPPSPLFCFRRVDGQGRVGRERGRPRAVPVGCTF
eukprot:scaffold183947_cov24-Tisochrysis_lutea.AAC.3